MNRNVEQDKENYITLKEIGWKVLIVWECELQRSVRENLHFLQLNLG